MQEIKKDKREDLFAATPPLEAKKMLFLAFLASVPGACWDFGEVVRAYIRATARRRVCVESSSEEFEEGRCGLLKKAPYWARDAAHNPKSKLAEMMTEAGFRQGSFSVCVFYRDQKKRQGGGAR